MTSKMSKPNQSRRIASRKLHRIFAEIADEICKAQDHVTIALSGTSFQIHLEGATININIKEEGGAK